MVITNRGFIKERDREIATYRGYTITIESDQVIVHAPHGSTRATFKSLPAARAFVRWLHREES